MDKRILSALTGTALTLLLLLLCLRLRGRNARPVAILTAVDATLGHYPKLNNARARSALLGSRDGLAIATLLLNAAAKQHPELYKHKVVLLRAVIEASKAHEWWAVEHTHPEATVYRDTVMIYVETTAGPLLDIDHIQLTAHVSKADADAYFADAPEANGRSWAGIPLQPRAAEIAVAYIEKAGDTHRSRVLQ